MNVEEIRDHVQETPFKPFALKLSNGDSHVVEHPDLVNMTRNTVYLFVDVADDEIPERMIRLGALHICALEPLAQGSVRENGDPPAES